MTLREAINAKCRECVHDPYAPGGWREQVEACGCPNCPLYPVRPHPRRRNEGRPAGEKTAFLAEALEPERTGR